MNRFLPIGILFFVVACSIIEDSDISSLKEFEQIKLKSIQITQVVNTAKINQQVKVDSIVENVDGSDLNAIYFSWPEVFSTSKLKFRSGVTTKIKVKLVLRKDGQIKACFVYSDIPSEYESYIFAYNSTGKRISLTTTITDVITETTLYRNYDQYDPPGNYFAYRNLGQASGAIIGGDPITATGCYIQMPHYYNYNNTNATYATKRQYNYCDKNNFFIDGGPSSGTTSQFYVIGDDLIEELFIGNKRTDKDLFCCSDQYYFHPVLISTVDLRLRVMYALDWWEEQTSSNPSFDKDQSVKLQFTYEPK